MSKHAPVKPTPKHHKPTAPERPHHKPSSEADTKPIHLPATPVGRTEAEETDTEAPSLDSTDVADLPPQAPEEAAKVGSLVDQQAAADLAAANKSALEVGDIARDHQIEENQEALQEKMLAAQALADIEAGKKKPWKKPEVVSRTLVHNTTGRLFTVAMYAAVDPSRPVASSKTFMLPPGVTPVPKDVWAKCTAKELSIQRLIEIGELVELGSKSLHELKEKPALDLVSLVVDRALLLEWRDGEKRSVVRAAVDNQLTRIGPSERPQAKKEQDEDEGDDQE